MPGDRLPQLHDVPEPRLADADLKPLLGLAALVWALTLWLYLASDEKAVTARGLLHEVTGGIAGAAFGVLIAGLVFDRLKQQAQRDASRRLEEQRAEIQRVRRELWIEEYSPAYEGLVEEISHDLSYIARSAFGVFRARPVHRALRERGFGGSFLASEDAELSLTGSQLDWSRSPTRSGHEALQRVAEEVRRSTVQLRDLSALDEEAMADVDLELLKQLMSDASACVPEMDRAVERVWRALIDLRPLHTELLDDRLPEPELSLGTALAHGIKMRDAISGMRWEVNADREFDRGLVFGAQGLLNGASWLLDAGAALYEHVVGLQQHMSISYIEGLSFKAGADFLRMAAVEQEATVERFLQFSQPSTTDLEGPLESAAKSAKERTFSRVRDEDRVPEYMLAAMTEQHDADSS